MAGSKEDSLEYDKFILRQTFPKPEDVFTCIPPKISELSEDCLFVFDTNILLDSYKLSESSINDIEKIFRKLVKKDRIFIPAQVVREFGRNRSTALKDVFDLLHNQTSNHPSPIPNEATFRCPMLEHSPSYKALIKSIDPLKNAVKEYKKCLKTLLNELKDWSWTDRVSKLYAELLVDRIIDHSKKDDEINSDLEWRITHNLPPGYKDKTKEDRGVGDLIIWHTILELGAKLKKHTLFVCNEEKPDWVIRSNNEIIGTREELRQEYFRVTSNFFSLISYSTFLSLMGAGKDTVNQAEKIEELESLDFVHVQQHVSTILQMLNEIISKYLAQSGYSATGYVFIRDNRLTELVSSFRRAREKYDAIIYSTTGNNFLLEMESMLLEIQSLNEQLGYHEVRMKRSGEREMSELRKYCTEFQKVYDRWRQWYLAGSP